MEIRPFELERFYERWEFRAELMLSSSDCESLALRDLLALEPGAGERLLDLRLGYTEVPGSQESREAIAGLYERIDPADVLTVAAAEEGIFLAYHALVAAGEHVVVESPCYGSAVEIARSTGAAVDLWQRHHEDRWAYDMEALERLVRPNTRLIYLNSPHNPTGSQMTARELERLVEIAAESSIVVLSDEVYRGVEHDPGDRLAGACDLYEHAISLGTVSKAYGLPGLRIGWLACRDAALLARMRDLKLYTSICSSAPSELLVALALRHGERLLARNRELLLANLQLVDGFLARHRDLLEWVRPTAAPIGFPRVTAERDVTDWCEQIAEQAGVLLLPGSVYGQPRHMRIGFGRANLPQAIERLERHLATADATPAH